MEEDQLADYAALKLRVAKLEIEVEALTEARDDAVEAIEKIEKAGMQPASAFGQLQTRLFAEVARVDQKVDALLTRRLALDEKRADDRARLGLLPTPPARQPSPFDPAKAVCTFCGRTLANPHGRAAHENRCEKNPATALQAWSCKCGTTGISNTGLGRHAKRCSVAADLYLMRPEPTPAPGAPIGPTPLQDAIRSMGGVEGVLHG